MSPVRKIILIIFIGSGLAFAAHLVLQRGLIKYSKHRHARLTEIYTNNTNYDVVYVGSSRTHTTIYPRIVDSITGLNTFNAGAEGAVMPEFKMTIDGYLLRHPAPTMIVLTIDPGSFDLSTRMFDPVQYFPFIGKNKYIKQELESNDKKNLLLTWVPFYAVTCMDDYTKNNAVKGLTGKTEMQPGQFDNKGFLSNGGGCLDSNSNYSYTPKYTRLDNEAVQILQSIIDLCREKNIQLMLTYAPEYRFKYREKFSNFDVFEKLVDSIVVKNDLTFYRDDSLALSRNPCYFANYGHTNTKGAVAYSYVLGERIRGLITND